MRNNIYAGFLGPLKGKGGHDHDIVIYAKDYTEGKKLAKQAAKKMEMQLVFFHGIRQKSIHRKGVWFDRSKDYGDQQII